MRRVFESAPRHGDHQAVRSGSAAARPRRREAQAMAAPLGGEIGDRRAQVQVAGERKPAIRPRVVKFGAGHLKRLWRKREIRIKVLHAENGAAVASPVSSAAAATRSIPKPPIGRIRSARLITGPSLLRVWPRHKWWPTPARSPPPGAGAPEAHRGQDHSWLRPPGFLKNSLTRRKASTPARPTSHPRRPIPDGTFPAA